VFKALATTAFIFGLMIVGYFCFAAPPKPVEPLSNVAITLIDVLGDGDQVIAGKVSTRCASEKTDGITNQFEMLLRKIIGSPGNTHYLNGVYVTLAPSGRRPVFQIRYPDPKYCDAFVKDYESCYAAASKESDPERALLPVGHCVKEAASKLAVTEQWEGLIEQYSKKPKNPVD